MVEEEKGIQTLSEYMELRNKFSEALTNVIYSVIDKGLSLGDVVGTFEGLKYLLLKEISEAQDGQG